MNVPDTPAPGLPSVSTGAKVAVALVGLVVALALAYFFRPWFQGLVFVLYTSPVLWFGILLALVLSLVVGALTKPVWGANLGMIVLVATILIGGAMAGLFADEYLGKQTMQESTISENLTEANPNEPRIVTRSVADRYASNTLNYPRYQVRGSDITMYNGTPHWSYSLSPDGFYNGLTKKQNGTVLVDMTQQNTAIRTVNGEVDKGIGTAFYNHYKWRTLKQGEYLVSYKDPFMVVHEEEQFIAVPYTKPKFHLLPLPHTTPQWGGVALIDSDGNVQDLSPQEAQSTPVLAEQKLYPFDLARERVAATKYRNGIVNTFTSHRGEIEVAPVPGENNDQPFFVLSEDGPEYIVAVEPYGDAQGLREVWTIDGRSGEYERYRPEESLFGPRKATDYVRQAARTTDWDRFVPAEPIPVVVDGQLYWEVRVVPNDSSGIAYIAFVNAQSSDVKEVQTTAQVTAFLEGRDVQDTVSGEGNQTQETPALVVQRVAPNGTVLDEMEVYGNETVVTRGNVTEEAP